MSPGSTATGEGLQLAASLGGLATLAVTNGPTGPSAGCEAILQVSPDGSTWHEYARQRAGTAATTTYAFHVEIPPGIMNMRASFVGNTAQSVDVEAHLQELTELG